MTPKTATFWYQSHGDPTGIKALDARHGQEVEVLGEVDPQLLDHGEPDMLRVRFRDGIESEVFAHELNTKPDGR